ncbi:DNA-binding transcriptional MocR family regulator [Streptacidiphilus sp. MAP12-20]|uniref:aminotransferase-like domain-containing protein n=1 Tax=Streptacidiphilus sp. MAP12-20 TaxID=3156299 RepID=UPI003512D572
MSDSSSTAALVTILREELARLVPGDRLPSSRELITRHGVSPVTVSRAIAQLAAEGAVVTRPGSGTYVAPRRSRPGADAPDTSWQAVALPGRDAALDLGEPPARPLPEGIVDLAGGYLHPDLQPARLLGAALARAARRPDAWDRAPAAGLSPLRAVFARQAGASVEPDDVLVTGGGQGALSMLFRALTTPGSPVLFESPTYPGALAAARAAGLRPVPVPMDGDGLRPELLADAFAMTGARVLYCQPTFHNPTGVVLAPERRRQIVDVARAAGAFLIEDDFARHLGHGFGPVPRPLVADDRDGTVVHVTSLTKPASPSLRIGAVIARGPVTRRLRGMRRVDDFFVSRPLQEAALELLSGPGWDRHVRALTTTLRDRAAVLTDALARDCADWLVEQQVSGGLHLWLRLPDRLDPTATVDAARERGVAIDPGHRYFPAEPDGPYVRVGFAAAASAEELREGAKRLGEVGGLS